MDILEIFGWISAMVAGIVMGLLGGGGSTIAVPVLVFLLGVSPVNATAYSLFIVGCAATIGTWGSMKRGQVDFKTGMTFAIPSLFAVYVVQRWGIPAIPEHWNAWGHIMSRDSLIMLVFSILMLGAAHSMIRESSAPLGASKNKLALWFVPLEGLVVGALTGLVGAGGGFLIIPALVLFTGLNMQVAIGTSLLIISMKSFVGFFGALSNGFPMDWTLLLSFASLTMVGTYLGTKWRKHLDSNLLKKAFGWFILVMAIGILASEL